MVADVNFRAEKRDTFGTLVDEEQPLAPDFIVSGASTPWFRLKSISGMPPCN